MYFIQLYLQVYYLPIGLSIPIGQLSTHLGIDKLGMDNLWVCAWITRNLPNGNVTLNVAGQRRSTSRALPIDGSRWNQKGPTELNDGDPVLHIDITFYLIFWTMP